MGDLQIRCYPDPILRHKCSAVREVGKEERKIIKQMKQAMYRHKGVGLAAPQIGIDKQIVIADIGKGLLALINPQILTRKGEEEGEEGCLSLPEVRVRVKRAKEIVVHGLSEEGKEKQMSMKGLLARVIQHEIDHLKGVLIIDYLHFIKRFLLEYRFRRGKKG